MSMPVIDPRCEGPPPTQHAMRVAGEMARWLIAEQLKRLPAWVETMGKRRDGNPIAQRKFVARLQAIGGPCAFNFMLQTGKKGRYTLYIHRWMGMHPKTFKLLDEPASAIPERPLLVVLFQRITSKGRYEDDVSTLPAGMLTHHALARLAERCGARDPHDLLAHAGNMSIAIIKAVIDGHIKSFWPEKGAWNIPFPGGVAVTTRHKQTGFVTIMTVLGEGMEYTDHEGVVQRVDVNRFEDELARDLLEGVMNKHGTTVRLSDPEVD